MRTWMSLWLFPLGLFGAVALVALNSVTGDVLALVCGFMLVPYAVAWVIRRSPGGEDQVRDLATHYWRTRAQ